jgi:hypothetical protein
MTKSRFKRIDEFEESAAIAAPLATRYRLCYADAIGFGRKG